MAYKNRNKFPKTTAVLIIQKVNNGIPISEKTMVINFPGIVLGVWSPYPIVEIQTRLDIFEKNIY